MRSDPDHDLAEAGLRAGLDRSPVEDGPRSIDELRESEARYRALAEATMEAVCIHEGGRILDVNDAAVALFGYAREEAMGMSLGDLIDPSSHADMMADALALRDEPRTYLARRKDGSALPIEAAVRSCTYRGRPARVAVARDRSAETESAAAVRVSEERFRMVARATNDAIWEMDPATGDVVRGDTFAALFGYDPAEIGRSVAWWRERVHPEDGPRIDAALEAFRASGAESYADEYRFRRADGSYAHVFDRSVLMRDARGAPVRVIGAMMDVTERRRMERKLEQSARLASLGTLSAGVAHEISNPLSYVIANVRMVEERLLALSERLGVGERGEIGEALSASASALGEAREGAERVHRIVADLKTFARAEEADRRVPVDVRRVLEAAAHLSGHEVRRRARLSTVLGAAPRVMANEARLGQVFLTLLRFAAQSIPPGAVADHEVRLSLGGAGDRVIVEIADTGPGLSADARARIFDPFFSVGARAPGDHAGLGLSMCHALVTGLGGEIQVESELGRGTVFRVSLPAAPDASDAAPPPSSAPPPLPTRAARVLVIDDEPMVGRMVERALGRAHEVTTAPSGKAALEQLQRGTRFDVILCDLMMPSMSGMDVYERVRALAPEQAERMVFLSGGAFTARARDFLEHHPSLEKPFDLGALEAVIRARVG